jgi:hypothetical protein
VQHWIFIFIKTSFTCSWLFNHTHTHTHTERERILKL